MHGAEALILVKEKRWFMPPIGMKDAKDVRDEIFLDILHAQRFLLHVAHCAPGKPVTRSAVDLAIGGC